MSKIILPKIVIADRLPPPPEFRVRLRPQHMRWEVGRYRERLRSGPGGLGRGKVWTPQRVGEQHNLIVNSAGDAMAQTLWRYLAYQAAVGTGSAAPATTDTALQVQVAATTAKPAGWQDQTNYGGSPGVWNIQVEREFTPAEVGGQNLTEWGFFTSASTMITRELFRDANANPITLTLAADQGLRLVYSYQITLSPISQAVSINITNIGTITGTLGISRQNPDDHYDLDVLGGLATANANYEVFVFLSARTFSYDSSPWGANQYVDIGGPPLPADGSGYYSYTSGSRQRQIRVEIPTSYGNGTIYALGFGNPSAPATGLYLAFDAGSEITKDNLHKLILDPWTISW